jgi:trigger factor
MKVDTQNAGPCKVKVIVKAEADETRPDYEEVVKSFLQHGRVPGFRQGKVPREIIKRDFHKEITEEVHGRLIRSLYKKAVEQEKIKMVALLDISDVLFSPETGITFAMTLEVQPEFDLPKYKKIPVPFEEPVVTEDQVVGHIDRLRKAFAKFEEAPTDYGIEAEDLVSIDFAGLIDGQPVKDLAPEAKAISEGTDFWIQVDEDRFLPEIVEAIKGLKAGASKEIKFKFDKEQPIEALRGRKAVYSVTVKTVRKRVLPTDAELLQQVKMESMEKLREQTLTNLTESSQQAEKQRREQAVIEFLLKKAEFDLPESQVSDEISATLDRMANEAHYRGLKREDLEKNREAIIENATASAKRQLRMRYVLGCIADQEKIELTEAEVDQKIADLSVDFRMKPDQLRAQIEKNERMGTLRKQIRDEKTMQFLLAEAKH